METRRSSSRLKNKTIQNNSTARKRKSASPEPQVENERVPSPKKTKVEPLKSDESSLLSMLDKARHDSIEKCVAGAACVNLSDSSDSESDQDETQPIKTVIEQSDDTIDREPQVETSEYFDFSQILSKQNSMLSLLSQTQNSGDTDTKALEGPQNNIIVDENTRSCIENNLDDNVKCKSKAAKRENLKLEKPSNSRSSNRKKPSQSSLRGSKKTVENETKPKNELDVKELLAMGEGVDSSLLDNCEEETKNDYKIPDKVEITLDLPNAGKKRKKTGFDLEAALKRRLNLVKKEHQVFVHKVHLLCLLSHGFSLNKCLNCENLIGVALSLIPSKHCYPPKHADISYLESFMSWYCKKISIKTSSNMFNIDCTNIISHLILCFNEHTAENKTHFILMFIIVMRSLGLKCRLVINLQPEPLKPSADVLLKIPTSSKSSESTKKVKSEPKKEIKKDPRFANKKEKQKNKTSSKYFQSDSNETQSKYFKGIPKDSLGQKSSSRKCSNSKSGNKLDVSQPSCSKSSTKPEDFIMSDDEDSLSNDSDFVSPKKSSSKSKSKSSTKKDNSSAKKSPCKKVTKKDRKVLSSDSSETENTQTNTTEKKKGLDVWCEVFLEAEEKWISVDITNKRYHCVEKLYSAATHPMSYVLAWNNDNTVKDLTKRYAPQWLTLTQKLRVDSAWWRKTLRPYLPAKNAWEREEDEEMERHLKDQPLPMSQSEYKNHPLYVLSKDLLKFQAIYPPDVAPAGYFRGEKVYPRSAVKELHTRETWLKEARVVRLGEKPFKIVKARVKKDKVRRWKVARKTCRAWRETIQYKKTSVKKRLKETRVVRLGQKPFKNVKERVRRDKFGFLPTEEKKSELFGIWQTEDYIPPVAQDGVVPRNSFGNVDLFLECMLPTGTVHLQLPQLQRIARKLNIDCAPAMVGFEPCRFGSRPVMDGWVVCEEFRDVLLDAWNQEYDEKTKAENEKRRKRAKGNWRKLVRLLRVKKRLEARYQFNLETGDAGV